MGLKAFWEGFFDEKDGKPLPYKHIKIYNKLFQINLMMISPEYSLCYNEIEKFTLDLKSLPITEVVNKYLRSGEPFIFQERDDYFNLKKDIGLFFNVDHSKVYMIGSCKLGFSINPSKLWGHVNEDSDIDIAIIDEVLFDKIWKNLFDINIDMALTSQMKKDDKAFHLFLDYLFRGWLRPDIFPFQSQEQKKIFEFTKSLYSRHQRKVSVGIFKNEYFFTKYHEENLKKIK